MRFGTRPGPRACSISAKISRTRPCASSGLIRRIRAIRCPPLRRPRDGTVVAVLAAMVPPHPVIAILSTAHGQGHHPVQVRRFEKSGSWAVATVCGGNPSSYTESTRSHGVLLLVARLGYTGRLRMSRARFGKDQFARCSDLNPLAAAILFKTRRGPLCQTRKVGSVNRSRPARVVPTIHAMQAILGFSRDGLGASQATDARLAGHYRVP